MRNNNSGYCVILLILITALLLSCSTTYVAEIKPVGVNTFVKSGRVVASQNKSGIEAYLTLLDNPPGMLLFDVQVANKSDYNVNVKPADIFLVPMSSLNDNTNPANAATIIKALDSKNEVKKIEKEINDAKSGYTTSIILDIGLTILGAAIYTAVEDDENPEVYGEMAGDLLFRRIDAAVDYDRFMGDLNYRKNFVGNNSLKETTVSPDGHVYGAVMLPVDVLPRYFKVVVPLNGSFFEFPFEVIMKKQ